MLRSLTLVVEEEEGDDDVGEEETDVSGGRSSGRGPKFSPGREKKGCSDLGMTRGGLGSGDRARDTRRVDAILRSRSLEGYAPACI
jgi:hypothetical protein